MIGDMVRFVRKRIPQLFAAGIAVLVPFVVGLGFPEPRLDYTILKALFFGVIATVATIFSSARLRALAMRTFENEGAWDCVGAAAATAWVFGRLSLEEDSLQKYGPWESGFHALSEASAPALVLILIRYFYRFHRHGDAVNGLISLLNRSSMGTGIRAYVRDLHFGPEGVLGEMLEPRGVLLGSKLAEGDKYKLACYLLNFQAEQAPRENTYAATMVSLVGVRDEWERKYVFPYWREPVELTFAGALKKMSNEGEGHRRLLVLSKDELNKLAHNTDAMELVKLYADCPKADLHVVIMACGAPDLVTKFRQWAAPEESDLHDFGVIGGATIFGTLGIQKPFRMRASSDAEDVERHKKCFEELWLQTTPGAPPTPSTVASAKDLLGQHPKVVFAKETFFSIVKGDQQEEATK
jgi:hypothetical protein